MTPATLRKHINLLYASYHLDDAPRVWAAVEALQGIDVHRQYRPLMVAIKAWLDWRIRDAELERRRAVVVEVRDLVSSGGAQQIDKAAALAAGLVKEAA